MRFLGHLCAFIVGFVLWGFALALSDGAAPLGRTSGNEVLVFFIPIVTFGLPLAVMAFAREYVMTGTWILAVAPVLGFLDFSVAASVVGGESGAWDKGLSASTLSILAAIWLLLLGVVFASAKVLTGSSASSRRSNDA
jgi:hypothetical protein